MAKDKDALYAEALKLLRDAPARRAVMDERYWKWRRTVEAYLERLPK